MDSFSFSEVRAREVNVLTCTPKKGHVVLEATALIPETTVLNITTSFYSILGIYLFCDKTHINVNKIYHFIFKWY